MTRGSRHGGGGGAIAAGHVVTAEVGADVLARGGNACDAVVAAAVASWVAEPALTGPCGGGFLVYRDAASARTVALDFFVAAPGLDGRASRQVMASWDVEFGTAVQRFWFGVASCAVPGTAAGVGEAHRRWGSLPWAELVAPAVALARTGVPVATQQDVVHRLLDGILRSMPEGARVFAPDGRLAAPGEFLRQTALAGTLERIAAAGSDDLYTGALAAEIAAFFEREGGSLSAADLAAYRVIARRPLRGRFRDAELFLNPPASSGGVLLDYSLRLHDAVAPTDDALGVAEIRLLAATLREAERLRGPAFERALRRRRARGMATAALPEGRRRVLRELAGRPAPIPAVASPRGTTHISVVDARGNAAAMTCSTGCGSGVFVETTGLHMNNMLGEEDLIGAAPPRPGERLTSMMTPTLLLRSDGTAAVLGSSGSARIRSALQRVITGLVDHGLDPAEAIERPRVHVTATGLDCESGFPDAALDAAEAAGEPVVRWPERGIYFGGTQVALRRGEHLAAAGDPRRGGHGIVVEPS